MTLIGAPQLNAKLVQLEKRLDGIAKAVAGVSVGDVAKAVQGDLGDSSMSGWRRGSPIPIVGAYKVTGPGVAEVTPKGKNAGQVRVLESGRNPSGSATPRLSKKTGRALKARRWNGTTQGRGTWSDAEQLVQQSLGQRSAKALHDIMAKTFRGS